MATHRQPWPRRLLQTLRAAGLAVCALAPLPAAAEAPSPVLELLLSRTDRHYTGLAEQFQTTLREACASSCPQQPRVRITPLEQWDANSPRDLLIPVGHDAAEAVSRTEGPVLYGLIPRANWEALGGAADTAVRGAVFLDQPVIRHLRLIKAAMSPSVGGRLRVGVLYGPDALTRQAAINHAAALLEMDIVSRAVTHMEDVGPAVEALTPEVDVLLAVPDSMIYNRYTLYGILLTSYGARVPVIGYSASLVDAGAMLGLYTSVTDMAQQLALQSAYYLRTGGRLPPPGPSDDYQVSVNRNVARSLGYQLPEPGVLRFRIHRPGDDDASAQAAK